MDWKFIFQAFTDTGKLKINILRKAWEIKQYKSIKIFNTKKFTLLDNRTTKKEIFKA